MLVTQGRWSKVLRGLAGVDRSLSDRRTAEEMRHSEHGYG